MKKRAVTLLLCLVLVVLSAAARVCRVRCGHHPGDQRRL